MLGNSITYVDIHTFRKYSIVIKLIQHDLFITYIAVLHQFISVYDNDSKFEWMEALINIKCWYISDKNCSAFQHRFYACEPALYIFLYMGVQFKAPPTCNANAIIFGPKCT